ncbi:MAG: DUF6516 family protein [Thermodesulfobacteriota bacterium]
MRYTFHWQDRNGNLLLRRDNADHWPHLETSAHRRPVGNAQTAKPPSDAATLREVLLAIRRRDSTAGPPVNATGRVGFPSRLPLGELETPRTRYTGGFEGCGASTAGKYNPAQG